MMHRKSVLKLVKVKRIGTGCSSRSSSHGEWEIEEGVGCCRRRRVMLLVLVMTGEKASEVFGKRRRNKGWTLEREAVGGILSGFSVWRAEKILRRV
jgi:hypothetical protein